MKTKLTGCILWLILLTSVACLAQAVTSEEDQQTVSVFTGARLYSRTLDGETEETVEQWVFPLFASAMVTENLNIRIYQTVSTSKLEDDPGLNGLESTRIRGALSLLDNKLIAYLGAGLPISEVTPEEEMQYLSELLYMEVLQFGISRLTEGFDLDGGLAFVQPFGKLSLGIGAGYMLRGSFDKLAQGDNLISYDPGNVISATAGLHYYTGPALLYGGVKYFHYGDDSIGEDESFENGDELSFSAVTMFRPGPITITLHGTGTIKGDSDASQAEADISNFFTDRVDAGGILAYSLFSDTITLKTKASVKWLIDDGETDAKAFTFGGGFELVITDNVTLDVLAGFMTGDMDTGETDISGFNLSSIIRIDF